MFQIQIQMFQVQIQMFQVQIQIQQGQQEEEVNPVGSSINYLVSFIIKLFPTSDILRFW